MYAPSLQHVGMLKYAKRNKLLTKIWEKKSPERRVKRDQLRRQGLTAKRVHGGDIPTLSPEEASRRGNPRPNSKLQSYSFQ